MYTVIIIFTLLLLFVLDLTEKQSLENAQLRREKSAVENELLKYQVETKTLFEINIYLLLTKTILFNCLSSLKD